MAYHEYERQRDIDEAQALMTRIAQIPAQVQREAAVANEAERRRQAALQIQDRMARMLATDEQCIGGTVIRVSGSTYVQASGADGRPVACEGRYRLRPR